MSEIVSIGKHKVSHGSLMDAHIDKMLRGEKAHRIRYEMVRKAEQLGFSGRFKFKAAVLLCGRERDGSVPPVKAVKQSYNRTKKNPSFGSLSAQYVTAPSRSATDVEKEQRELVKGLNAIARKQQS